MKKDFTELTVGEFYLMEKERLKVFHVSNICADCEQNWAVALFIFALLFSSQRKVCHKKMAYFRDFIDHTLESIKSQSDSMEGISKWDNLSLFVWGPISIKSFKLLQCWFVPQGGAFSPKVCLDWFFAAPTLFLAPKTPNRHKSDREWKNTLSRITLWAIFPLFNKILTIFLNVPPSLPAPFQTLTLDRWPEAPPIQYQLLPH